MNEIIDALMRMQLNTDKLKTWDANDYTKQYNERDNHFLCDDSMAPDNRKKEKCSEEDDYNDNISPYSTLF